jgi:hypothetical protein
VVAAVASGPGCVRGLAARGPSLGGAVVRADWLAH